MDSNLSNISSSFNLVPAPYTPMKDDGSLNLSQVGLMYQRFLQKGIHSAFIAGTTGECHSLTLQERMDLTTEWVQLAGDHFKVIVHVGHNCLSDAKALAAHAQASNARAVAATPPFYFRPSTPQQILAWIQPIAQAAPDLPFYFYHIPSMTGVETQLLTLVELAVKHIPNFKGIKFSHNDFCALQDILQFQNPPLEVFFGWDEALISAIALGAQGAVGSTYNYASAVYHSALRCIEVGDWETARFHQYRTLKMIQKMKPFGLMAAGKAMMEKVGIPCGPVRQPLQPLTPSEKLQLLNSIQDDALFE